MGDKKSFKGNQDKTNTFIRELDKFHRQNFNMNRPMVRKTPAQRGGK